MHLHTSSHTPALHLLAEVSRSYIVSVVTDHMYSNMAVRAYLAVAVLAVCFALAAGQAQLCDPKKAPGEPWNTLLNRNDYDAAAKVTKLSMTWRSPVKTSSDGCLDGYRIEYYDGSKRLGYDQMNANPITSPLSYIASATPGKKITIKIVAVNKQNNKESKPADVATITAAAAPKFDTAVPVRR